MDAIRAFARLKNESEFKIKQSDMSEEEKNEIYTRLAAGREQCLAILAMNDVTCCCKNDDGEECCEKERSKEQEECGECDDNHTCCEEECDDNHMCCEEECSDNHMCCGEECCNCNCGEQIENGEATEKASLADSPHTTKVVSTTVVSAILSDADLRCSSAGDIPTPVVNDSQKAQPSPYELVVKDVEAEPGLCGFGWLCF